MTRSKDSIKQLIDYITIMPEDVSDQKRCHKFKIFHHYILTIRHTRYPFLASEIFEADIAQILNPFFNNRDSSTAMQSDYNSRASYKFRKRLSGDDFEYILGDESDDSDRSGNNLQTFEDRKSRSKAHQNTKDNDSKDYTEINDSSMSSSRKSPPSAVSSSTSLLEYLFGFVEMNEDLNLVLCGYFNKLVNTLMKRNSRKVSRSFLCF